MDHCLRGLIEKLTLPVVHMALTGKTATARRLRNRIEAGFERWAFDLITRLGPGPLSRDGWRQALAETPIDVPNLRTSKRVLSHVLVKRRYQNAVIQAKAVRRQHPTGLADTIWPQAFPDVPPGEFSDLHSPHDAAAAAVAYQLRTATATKHPSRWTVKLLGQSKPTLKRERAAAEVDDAVVAWVLGTRGQALCAELRAVLMRPTDPPPAP